MKKTFLIFFYACIVNSLIAQDKVFIDNDLLNISWTETPKGWFIDKLTFKNNITLQPPTSGQTIIFNKTKPNDKEPSEYFLTNVGEEFPEKVFRYPKEAWNSNTNKVSLNTAGIKYPVMASKLISRNPLTFLQETPVGNITTVWSTEKNQIIVKQTLKAKQLGYYSVSTPTLFSVRQTDIQQAVIPGYLFANSISNDFVSGYGYGHYIPNKPVIYKDRCATTPTAILTVNGFTISVSPGKDYPRHPHNQTASTHFNWNVGYSMMNPQSDIFPTLYYPVLGQKESYLNDGSEVTFEYHYIITQKDWYDAFKQSVYDIFEFDTQRDIIENKQSLIGRVFQMYSYLTDTKTSKFRIADCEDIKIGAQDYLGGVVGSDKDAMKNSDYGAMWMLASLTQDTLLTKGVLPYARNFKIKQQYTDNSQFNGAVKGQYFLWKSKNWAEEWGQHIEPIGVTYYALMDMGNILLFEPNDKELFENFRLAADYLLKTQLSDGSWAVGYEKANNEIIYPDLKDLRPTFYGMQIAYDILKDRKYLDAAKKGADWFIENAVNTGRFIGVCGDTRFSPDFATSQSVQALLELYRQTNDERYKHAAIKTAEMYTTYVYTYPNGITEIQKHRDQTSPGWAFSQSGLCFEHAGTIGSSNTRGPILLASHAGMFVRMFGITGDSIFIDMARTAANGKDAFVDKSNGVASYYWDSFDRGAGSFPHHAWWQIGWIMDYLMSEAEMRSKGRISFPRGFITPKVGPHQTLGFANGKIDGKEAKLILIPELVKTDNPSCDYLTIVSDTKLYVVAMNSSSKPIKVNMKVEGNMEKTGSKKNKNFKNLTIEPFGLKIFEVEGIYRK